MDTDRAETILVVEDEGDLRALIRQKLEENTYKVIEAVDGDDGLKKAIAHQPALILLDNRMPGQSGYDMLRTLRARDNWGANVPVIFLSNIEPQSDQEIEDMTALKPADYFIKSNSNLDEVVRKVRHVLSSLK